MKCQAESTAMSTNQTKKGHGRQERKTSAQGGRRGGRGYVDKFPTRLACVTSRKIAIETVVHYFFEFERSILAIQLLKVKTIERLFQNVQHLQIQT